MSKIGHNVKRYALTYKETYLKFWVKESDLNQNKSHVPLLWNIIFVKN